MSNNNPINRRQFVKKVSTAAAVFSIVPRHVLGGDNFTAPSEKLNVAGVGIGGMGASNVNNCKGENIYALCDVHHNHAAKVFNAYPKAKKYVDYREMLAKEKDIDAVIIATPDHTHAVIAMAAIKAGKHVYVQKPMTHNVYETRKLTEAAKAAGVVTQMGIQGHSSNEIRIVREWIEDGAIGDVREIHSWCSLTYYPWGYAYWSPSHSARPTETPAVPDGLDWDLWLGPAPVRPYHRCYHPGSWRAWWDFGSGMMADRGCHTLDPAYWILKLGQPISVEANRTDINNETHPVAAIVNFKFPARGKMPPVTLTWYDGLRPPLPDELTDGWILGSSEGGSLFVGNKAKLMHGVYGESPRLLPETTMKSYKKPAKTIPRVNGTHEQNWLDAIKNGTRANADFEYSGPFTEMIHLGNIAIKLGRKLYWNAEKMEFTNDPEATKLLTRDYRQGWSL
ncbi:MAG: Gfo/Idh/MocA family oxidoreductase [Phycisphaerae bacterium]|nr:Gfo/Idh/MocA family oxidoreductase [Phycisphaerae bacterium]